MKLHSFWSSFPEMEERLGKVAVYFDKILDETPALIRPALESLLGSPGKMLRPAFVLMSAEAGDRVSENLYSVAAAIELLHTASLIHDDIIDYSSERRGKPSLHTVMGVKKAVLAGDYLLVRALELASAAHEDGLIDAVNNGAASLCLSEIEQDSDPGNYFIDRETYYSRIHGKTAELFALSCRVGAVLGGAEKDICDDLYNIGKNFGTAFQIFDDVFDYQKISERTGKPSGNDLKDGIPTLPLILALEKSDQSLKRLCRSKFRFHRRSAIRKKVLAGGFNQQAAVIGDQFIQKSVDQLNALVFPDQQLFIRIINEMRHSYEPA